jgi:hypothetical protein
MTTDLRSCPFCDSSDLTIAKATDDEITTVAIVCLECGATGPKGTAADSVAHVEHMWNQGSGHTNDARAVPPLSLVRAATRCPHSAANTRGFW